MCSFLTCQESPIDKEEWTEGTIRCGVIGVKLGMTTHFSKEGAEIPCTAVQVSSTHVNEENRVTHVYYNP